MTTQAMPAVPDRSTSDALSEIYHAHAGAMLRVAYHLLGTRADAEDAVHDVFLALPDSLARYRDEGKLGAWLRTLTVRVALGKMRRRRREVPLGSADDRAAPDKKGMSDWLERGIRSLPDKLRVVFVLKEIEGYSHSEIGELLGIRKGTSEVRHHRAIRHLRRVLKEET